MEGMGARGRNAPNNVYTYELMNKEKKRKQPTTNAGKGVRKMNPYIVLVAIYISTTTMEIYMAVHQKIKNIPIL
jgi:hypothetical protein